MLAADTLGAGTPDPSGRSRTLGRWSAPRPDFDLEESLINPGEGAGRCAVPPSQQ
jgi:hypothetical protein